MCINADVIVFAEESGSDGAATEQIDSRDQNPNLAKKIVQGEAVYTEKIKWIHVVFMFAESARDEIATGQNQKCEMLYVAQGFTIVVNFVETLLQYQ